MMKKTLFGIFFCMSSVSWGFAGEVDVLKVDIKPVGNEDFRFSVTVEHADDGWDHYADGWEVIGQDGTVYGKRVLAHPHVDEQPFTRSGKVTVPQGVKTIIVRGHDSVHGLGGVEMTIELPGR